MDLANLSSQIENWRKQYNIAGIAVALNTDKPDIREDIMGTILDSL